ncbi:MAG TPA: OmpA family protein [Proteiniphilum sp.]|nr:OmpA family protein [Proteiniphilum sp.]HPD85813.1 OmpA family protein [Proteiniphilum sp.]HPJ49250.1 OmpA family protein [Proteiniphilum sp.]HPR20541.1 OmpA family protein [Proteiniphilum sp.]
MRKVAILLSFCLLFVAEADAQKWLNKLGNAAKEAAKNAVERRVEEKAEKATEKAMDKAEESVTKEGKSNKSESNSDDDAMVSEEGRESAAANSGQSTPLKLTGTSQYDFVPGDQILYFEDFSQDAIGDFPALWTTNSGGEVKTVNIAPGKWFHMNGEDATYCYTRQIDFPDNFIVEYDIIPDENFNYGIQFTLYQESSDKPQEMNDDLFPGEAGLHIVASHDVWETKGYKDTEDWIEGHATRNTVVREQENHVIIWIQKRRVRIYHRNAKVLDMPTNIYPGVKFNRMRFSGWDCYSTPSVSNLKITTASPDTLSKLITEGKLVTYGITFDVNKAEVKPESFGTLKSIADVLKENGSVKVKITGHTDSDGDDAKNMELSQRRAASVKSELASKFGIDASRMETEGAGETTPVAPNDTPANKALNRRVELVKL